jgi:hypothetical protein
MKTKNDLIYSIREIIGDEKPNGFFTPIDGKVEVPNYLFKDGKSEYPEIRISVLDEEQKLPMDFSVCSLWANIKDIYSINIQLDIYSKSIPEVNKISRVIETRLEDFMNPDTIGYGYSSDFVNMGDYYKNSIYENKNFNIGWIQIDKNMIKQVFNIDELVNNSWFMNDEALYIKTDLDITKIKVLSIYNGRMFANNESPYSRGIFAIKLTNEKNLSMLESNEVERVMMELNIIYGLDRPRRDGPLVEKINIGAKDG